MQTSVRDNQNPQLFAGQIVSSPENTLVETFVNSEASAEIEFGAMVKNSDVAVANDVKEAEKLTAAANVLAGIVAHSQKSANQLGDDGILPTMLMSVLTKGTIVVTTETAVQPGDAVRVRHTVSGGGAPVGRFTKTADAGKTLDISKFARWKSYLGAAGLAELEIDLTMAANASADT